MGIALPRLAALAIDAFTCYLPAYIGITYATAFLFSGDGPVGMLQLYMPQLLYYSGLSDYFYAHLGLLATAFVVLHAGVRVLGRHYRLQSPVRSDRFWGLGLTALDIGLRLAGLSLAGVAAAAIIWLFHQADPSHSAASHYGRGYLGYWMRELILPLALGFVAAWEGNGQTGERMALAPSGKRLLICALTMRL